MNDWEYLKQVGIEIPQSITFAKTDWTDFYRTLAEFKARVMKRHGFNPRDTFHPTTGKLISGLRSERFG